MQNWKKKKQNFAVVKKQTEARIAALNAKQKKEAEKLAQQNKSDQQMKDQINNEKRAMQMQRDSAVLKTPPPAATFKIQR
ncbi:hypothetical protein [Chryseobacterium sp. P1-3]|uniref:hypothetical protein n=1 Tax=Chryseobacterium sp. (strain P1-3) TaxID=1517683 RepID=UPI000A54184D|nr:hypothetical protein [Chryseobacterium sp. P1-3]